MSKLTYLQDYTIHNLHVAPIFKYFMQFTHTRKGDAVYLCRVIARGCLMLARHGEALYQQRLSLHSFCVGLKKEVSG